MPDHPHTLAHWDDAVRDEVVADGGNLLDKVAPVLFVCEWTVGIA
jgi:hypothetical protein